MLGYTSELTKPGVASEDKKVMDITSNMDLMNETRSRNPINPISGYSDVINAVHKINKGRRSQKGPELGLYGLAYGLLFLVVMTFPIAKRLLLTFCFDNLQTLS
jgi:hypothetical protein